MIQTQTPAGWFAVALERDVRPRRLVRARIGDVPLVIWRADDGDVSVWIDQCPHRSVRLSAGRNCGSSVQCAYHGWTFAKDGALLAMPVDGHRSQQGIGVGVVESTTADGLVFARLSDGSEDGMPEPGLTPAAELLRPIHFRTGADTVRKGLSAMGGLRVFVTPTGDGSCVVHGHAGAGGLDSVRRADERLEVLRREIESGVVR